MERLRSRIRGWTLFFIFGLALSGATALPIPTELVAGVAVLGEDMCANGLLPEAASSWLRTLSGGDSGHVREGAVHVWWRAIDSAFGVVGFVPVWLCHRWTEELGQMERARG